MAIAALRWRAQRHEMRHRKYESSDQLSRIHNNRDIRCAAECVARSFGLCEIVAGNQDVARFSSNGSTSALDGNSKPFVSVRISRNQINSGVIDASAFKAVF
jgi:hypothetical protein